MTISSLLTTSTSSSTSSEPTQLIPSSNSSVSIATIQSVFSIATSSSTPSKKVETLEKKDDLKSKQVKPLNSNKTLIQEFVDWRQETTLKGWIKDAQCLVAAKSIIQGSYEVPCKSLMKGSSDKYGYSFCLPSEPLAYVIERISGKKVLEIGAGFGECSALLALAGAKNVYLNDISEVTTQCLSAYQLLMPSNASKRINAIIGDCFSLYKSNKLPKDNDFLICRNVLHFFDRDQFIKFPEILKNCLKPGSEALITVNGAYFEGFEAFSKISGKTTDWKSTISYKMTQCEVVSNTSSTPIPMFKLFELASLDENVTLLNTWNLYTRKLVTKNSTSKWEFEANKEEFGKIDKKIKPSLLQALKDKENKKSITSIKEGPATVRVTQGIVRCFTKINLADYFEKNGLTVLETFALNSKGHIVQGENIFGKALLVGALIQNLEKTKILSS